MSLSQYNDAIQLKKDIDLHNAAIQNLISSNSQNSNSKTFNFDGLRYLSDFQKLSDIHSVQNKQLLAQTETSFIKKKLADYYHSLFQENTQFLNKLNNKITDRNQIVNINQHSFDRKDLYASILSSFFLVLIGILFLVFLLRFGIISRNNFLIILVISLISYLSYIIYLLIQVRYFRDPNFTVYRHTIGENVSAETCPVCDNDNGNSNGGNGNNGSGRSGSKYECPVFN